MSKHHHPKETPPVLPKPEGQTDFLKRRLDRWAMVIKWALKEMRTIVLAVISIAVASAVAYNHFHSASLHQTTKDQLGQLWHHVHVLEDRLGDPDSVGKGCLTTNADVAKVIP